jgi:hypothetical protein
VERRRALNTQLAKRAEKPVFICSIKGKAS